MLLTLRLPYIGIFLFIQSIQLSYAYPQASSPPTPSLISNTTDTNPVNSSDAVLSKKITFETLLNIGNGIFTEKHPGGKISQIKGLYHDEHIPGLEILYGVNNFYYYLFRIDYQDGRFRHNEETTSTPLYAAPLFEPNDIGLTLEGARDLLREGDSDTTWTEVYINIKPHHVAPLEDGEISYNFVRRKSEGKTFYICYVGARSKLYSCRGVRNSALQDQQPDQIPDNLETQ